MQKSLFEKVSMVEKNQKKAAPASAQEIKNECSAYISLFPFF